MNFPYSILNEDFLSRELGSSVFSWMASSPREKSLGHSSRSLVGVVASDLLTLLSWCGTTACQWVRVIRDPIFLACCAWVRKCRVDSSTFQQHLTVISFCHSEFTRGSNSRFEQADDWISELKDELTVILHLRIIKKNEQILRDLRDTIKCTNIWIMKVPEGEVR